MDKLWEAFESKCSNPNWMGAITVTKTLYRDMDPISFLSPTSHIYMLII
jgi:hypothetical protein